MERVRTNATTRSAPEQFTRRFDFDQPILILSIFSIIAATIVLILSAINLSLPLNLAVACLTLVYFAAFHILRYQHLQHLRHHPRAPKALPWMYSWISISGASLIGILWPMTIVVWAVTLMEANEPVILAQIVISGIEILFMGATTMMLGFARRHHFAHCDEVQIRNLPLGRDSTTTSTSMKHVKADSISTV